MNDLPKYPASNNILISSSKIPDQHQVIHLYEKLGWSAAGKPQELYAGLIESHSLVTAWDSQKLVGLGNAISDGHLVVYYPHLLVHPNYQNLGIGRKIMDQMQTRYHGFHMQMLTADQHATDFYGKMGFQKAGDTIPMWIYDGSEH